ncbi:tail fiber domain-containing protein [Enterobacter bugandensis]|uniref:tail fiber domain-containing protein n=1 Tax=Enterobacter bugandensis TaxID=881260 RepID=UPI002003517D|nr:tail fiber domain-containing protein [Enterobacter bugandensis]MCK7162586.1 tail fiber domain-containing protein [Enterobacter bugandensis]
MSAGTITLTNGSAIVGGSGTSFTTELAAGDFIVSNVGGVPYTLPVKTVDSGTQLTLVSNFTGPTQSGAAWSAVPRVALNMVTAALVAQSAEALRGLNYDKQNWQQVFSAAGNITVKLPDGTTFKGPSWPSVISQTSTLNGKTGGNVTGTLMVTQGSSIGVSTQEGGDKTVKLYNITGDGSVGGYVNAVGGAWYNGNWSLGGVRGSGTNLDRAQLNVNSGTGTAGSFLFYPDERFKSSSCGANGAGYGGSWSDINTWQRNISFFRGNVAVNNDAGFIPFARWHSQCSGGYSSTVGLGSIATGPSSWADVAITTLGDGGSAGQRIFQLTTANGDIYANAGGNLSGNYIFQKQPNCDITLKHDIKYDDGYQSYENIKKFLPATYVYNDDPRERVRRGIIAQDVMKIDSEYVKLVPAAPKFDDEGNRIDADDTLALDNNVIMLDTVLALNYVIKQLETTQKEILELKQKIAES